MREYSLIALHWYFHGCIFIMSSLNVEAKNLLLINAEFSFLIFPWLFKYHLSTVHIPLFWITECSLRPWGILAAMLCPQPPIYRGYVADRILRRPRPVSHHESYPRGTQKPPQPQVNRIQSLECNGRAPAPLSSPSSRSSTDNAGAKTPSLLSPLASPKVNSPAKACLYNEDLDCCLRGLLVLLNYQCSYWMKWPAQQGVEFQTRSVPMVRDWIFSVEFLIS